MARKPQLPGADAFFTPASSVGAPSDSAKPEGARAEKTAVSTPETGVRERAEGRPRQASTPARISDARQPMEAPQLTQGNLHDGLLLIATPGEAPRPIPQPPTEKVTFYMPPHMLEQLEVCRVRLLTEHGIKVGRSQIAQAALALTLHTPQLLADALTELARIWEEYAE